MRNYLLFCLLSFIFLTPGFSPSVSLAQNSLFSVTGSQQKETPPEKTPWRPVQPVDKTKKPLVQPTPLPSPNAAQATDKKVTAVLSGRRLEPLQKDDPRYGLVFYNFAKWMGKILKAQENKTGEGPVVVIESSNRDIQEHQQYSLKIRIKGITDPDVVIFTTDGSGYVRLQRGREPLSAHANVTVVRGKIWSYEGKKPWEDSFVLSLDLNKDGHQDNLLVIFRRDGTVRFAVIDAQGKIIAISEQEFARRAQAAAAARPRR